MKKVSIKDVAHEVGVSTATVSLVLSGKAKDGRVSKQMTEKIKNTARELNYQPNQLAISLQSGKTRTVGLLVADICNPFFSSLAFHIQEEMKKAGYAVIIMNTDESDDQMEQMVALLKSRQVDGFIIVPTQHGKECIHVLMNSQTPVVLIDRSYPDLSVPSILTDNYQASYEATRYLIKQNCKKVALLIYDNKLTHMINRKEGFIKALQEENLYDESLVKEVSYKNLTEYMDKAIFDIIINRKDVDGILFASNTIAINGIKQLLKLNIRIQEDIQVVCFDKNEAYEFMPVFIPYVQQPIAEIGRCATNTLLSQIKREPITENPPIPAKLITE